MAIFSPEHSGPRNSTSIRWAIQSIAPRAYNLQHLRRHDGEPHPLKSVLRKLDVLVIDIQDIGSRFYTYESTLGYTLESAAITGTEVVVLDRPNPLTGVHVQGPVSDGKHLNFVDYTREPIRHGMTVGELAKMFNSERHINAKLTVVPVKGWTRSDWFDSTDLVWINLSPNMRNMNEAALYTGWDFGVYECIRRSRDGYAVRGVWCAVDQTTGIRAVSECTPNPGCPISCQPGVTPAKDAKLGGQRVGGVQMIVTDRSVLDAPELGLELGSALLKLYPADWELDRLIDLLGNESTLEELKSGKDPRCIAEDYQPDLQQFSAVCKST